MFLLEDDLYKLISGQISEHEWAKDRKNEFTEGIFVWRVCHMKVNI